MEEIIIRSPRHIPPEMYSSLPYYRGYDEDSPTRLKSGLGEDIPRWNWQNEGLHHLEYRSPRFEDDKQLEMEGRFLTDKENKSVPMKFLYLDPNEAHSKRLTSTTRLSLSQPIVDASKEVSLLEKLSSRYPKYPTAKEHELFECSDAHGMMEQSRLRERFL